jgi:hypothetical protein
VEGCVRETWGALFGAYQAQNAQDPGVRRAMATIADDETRHAALSWQLHHWALSQLSATERASVDAAQRKGLPEASARSRARPAQTASLAHACNPDPRASPTPSAAPP